MWSVYNVGMIMGIFENIDRMTKEAQLAPLRKVLKSERRNHSLARFMVYHGTSRHKRHEREDILMEAARTSNDPETLRVLSRDLSRYRRFEEMSVGGSIKTIQDLLMENPNMPAGVLAQWTAGSKKTRERAYKAAVALYNRDPSPENRSLMERNLTLFEMQKYGVKKAEDIPAAKARWKADQAYEAAYQRAQAQRREEMEARMAAARAGEARRNAEWQDMQNKREEAWRLKNPPETDAQKRQRVDDARRTQELNDASRGWGNPGGMI